MKTYIQYLVFIGLVFFGCKKNEISEGIPECLTNIINEIRNQNTWNPPARLFRYKYNGQTVYFIPQRCCDIPSILMDEQCNVICFPDGGLSGGGDGKCQDFFSTRIDEKLVWEDTR